MRSISLFFSGYFLSSVVSLIVFADNSLNQLTYHSIRLNNILIIVNILAFALFLLIYFFNNHRNNLENRKIFKRGEVK